MEEVIYWKKGFYYMFWIVMSLSLIIIGSYFNVLAMRANGDKMPVMAEYIINDGLHFSYKDINSVNHWYITDMIRLGNLVASIGDILMWGGFCLYLYMSINLWWMRLKWKK